MPTCAECGEDYTSMENTCRYCKQGFCPDHRLPENHDCPGLRHQNVDTRHFESTFDDSVDASSSSRPMTETESIETQRTPGNSRNLEPESSPDVRPDGSLATDSGSNVNEHEKTNSGKIWWWMSHRAAATGRFAFWIVKGTAYIALVTVVAVAVLDFVFGLSILF